MHIKVDIVLIFHIPADFITLMGC